MATFRYFVQGTAAREQTCLVADRAELQRQLAALRAQIDPLVQYAQHTPECESRQTFTLVYSDPLTERHKPCTCGLADTLDALGIAERKG